MCKSNTVIYEGADLDCLGIKIGDNLESVLSKVNDFVCTVYADNVELCSDCVSHCGTDITCGATVSEPQGTLIATQGDTLVTIITNIGDYLCSLNSAIVKTFNLIPNKTTELSSVNRRMELSTANGTSSGQVIFGDQPFIFEIDRIGCIEDVTVQFINLPTGITNTSVLTVDSEDNDLYFSGSYPDISWTSLAVGVYDFALEFSTPTCGTKTFPYRLTITA